MPSLLTKRSFFDPETGSTMVISGDKFLWKEGKKDPEDSKVTRLVTQYGWKLTNGNNAWLIFKKKGNPGELFVVRGNKRWFYDLPNMDLYSAAAKGKGLDSLQGALDRDELTPDLAKAAASPAATAVNNAGNGHNSVDGDPLPEIHVWGSTLLQKKSEDCGCVRTAREPMHDDSGAQTGLRNRPDYGESDSYTSEMNEANAKGACLVLSGGVKTASGIKQADMYVSAVKYELGRAFKLASFEFSPNPEKAKEFMPRTAANLVKQIRHLCGQTARVEKIADESTLNGFSIESLEDFVGEEGDSKAAASAPAISPEIERDEPATDPDPEFLGARTREMSDDEMQDYMGRVMDWKDQESKTAPKTKKKTPEQKAEKEQRQLQKTKDKFNLPILHSGNIHIVNEGGEEYDTEKLKQMIMARPSSLLKKNEKMKHSDGTATQFYNIGLPALKGLAVNEKTGKFIIVDTCPGAGACKLQCYAMRGSYVQYPATSMGQSKILNFLVNHPEKFAARLKAEINVATTDVDEGEKVVVRWHDAGDFFSPQYMKLAFDVARAFPDVQFYAYTKVADVANASKPSNFIVNFSEGALPSETKKVDLTQIKKSVIVPQKMFWDLIVTKGAHTVKNEEGQVQFKGAKEWDQFKDRLAQTYQAPKDAIISYNEYVEMKREGELGDKPKWQVVVPPGAGDQAANDPKVLVSFLMWH
jgi:hypothetical protein